MDCFGLNANTVPAHTQPHPLTAHVLHEQQSLRVLLRLRQMEFLPAVLTLAEWHSLQPV